MPDTLIRNATSDDIPLIRELTFQIWPQTYASILSAEQISYMLDMMYGIAALSQQFNELNHRFILAYHDRQPAGFASYAPADPQHFKLHKIYILPHIQGKGIGAALIGFIADNIRMEGAVSLDLNVNRYNPAKKFYEKLGFTILKEEDIDIGNGYFMNDYVLRLSLT